MTRYNNGRKIKLGTFTIYAIPIAVYDDWEVDEFDIEDALTYRYKPCLKFEVKRKKK